MKIQVNAVAWYRKRVKYMIILKYDKLTENKQKKTRYTSPWKNLNFSGHNQLTKGLPINFDKRKQDDAPAVALKTTKRRPLITPKRAPASKDMKIVPGIINVCMKM
jgi:uncharacterized protein with NAD-binding domain and iron-sulfur cluster